jgi:transposase
VVRDHADVQLDPAILPNDVEALRAIVLAQHAEITGQRELIARLRLQLARLRRMQFGHSSERLAAEADQLELALEELEADAPAAAVPDGGDAGSADEEQPDRRKPARRPLPDHLPRETVEHGADVCACPACGGTLRRLAEDVTEVLDYVPGRFQVIRHVRPRWSCRSCETITQAPPPSLPIARGRATAGLLAHVLVAKYADHLPLYRQSEIYGRAGVALERSTLADWVGQSAALLRPLVDALARHVMSGSVVHADDTPVPVLAPGTGKTRTGRLWAYLRDERPHGSNVPPAVLYRYSPDRKAEHPRTHLRSFRGVLQADGYRGFEGLYEGGHIIEAACWAHVRRGFYDLHITGQAPLATEALRRIGLLYAVEPEIHGQPPDARARVRQARAGPVLENLHSWFTATLGRISGRSDLAGAIRYALARWEALTRYVADGRIEPDNNPVERAIRPLALGRKNWLFAGSDTGGHRAAAIASLVATARLNGLDPEAYLRNVLERIADHPVRCVAELLPWNITPSTPAEQS